MVDFAELMRVFSIPRPSGSAGERRTLTAIHAWLAARAIPYQSQRFRLFPYSNELIGLWLLGSVLLLALTVALRWPWPALLLVGAAIGLVVANVVFGWPLVVWPVARAGENLLMVSGPDEAEHELLITTHYDSKTELFDHTIQGRLFRWLPHCIALALVVLALGVLDRALLAPESIWSIALRLVSLALALPVVLIVGAVGVNLLPGRLIAQSQGAVDNGAACALVLALAERLVQSPPQRVRVALALFGGEEVSMQGSRAYVRSRGWSRPAAVINLELMGQSGAYVIWQNEGNVLTSAPTDSALNGVVAGLVQSQTGRQALIAGGINSDGYSFVRAGLPTCVLGSADLTLGVGGLHRPSDRIERVILERLPESLALLEALVRWYDERDMLPRAEP